MSTAAAWRARAKEIVKSIAAGKSRQVKEQIVQLLRTDPQLVDLDERLLRCWRRGDRAGGEFQLDRFEILLRSAVERLDNRGKGGVENNE
jgi:hypothetical protein